MQTKRVQDLVAGDKIALEDGIATVVKCERFPIVEVKNDLCYEIEWREEGTGETGRALQGGKDECMMANHA